MFKLPLTRRAHFHCVLQDVAVAVGLGDDQLLLHHQCESEDRGFLSSQEKSDPLP